MNLLLVRGFKTVAFMPSYRAGVSYDDVSDNMGLLSHSMNGSEFNIWIGSDVIYEKNSNIVGSRLWWWCGQRKNCGKQTMNYVGSMLNFRTNCKNEQTAQQIMNF